MKEEYADIMHQIARKYKVLIPNPNGNDDINRSLHNYFISFTESHMNCDPYANLLATIKNWLSDTEATHMEQFLIAELYMVILIRDIPKTWNVMKQGRDIFFAHMGFSEDGMYETAIRLIRDAGKLK